MDILQLFDLLKTKINKNTMVNGFDVFNYKMSLLITIKRLLYAFFSNLFLCHVYGFQSKCWGQ